jgi:hypothetical protein
MISADRPAILEGELPLDPAAGPLKVHRLIAEGFELSNAMERADWEGDIAWLQACELCGGGKCSGRGTARFARLGDQLVWMRTAAEDFPWDEPLPLPVESQGVISRSIWEGIRRMGYAWPESGSFGALRRAGLARLWLGEMPERARAADLTVLDRLLREELAANCPLEMDEARSRMRELIDWFRAAPDAPVAGRIARVDPPEGLHIFFFDRSGYPEWPAFAASGRRTLAFGGGFLHEFPADGLD